MLDWFRDFPGGYYYFWIMATVVGIVAIYYIWGRKTTPKDQNEADIKK